MIKKIIPIISVIFFLYSCGYQPIYTNKDKATISISEIIIIGDKDLSKQILSSINITENYGDDSYVLTLNAEHKDNITSKDNSGNPLTFQKSINVNLNLKKEINIISKNFDANFSYSNKESKFDLKEYQNTIKNNLIREISEKISIFLKLQK